MESKKSKKLLAWRIIYICISVILFAVMAYSVVFAFIGDTVQDPVVTALPWLSLVVETFQNPCFIALAVVATVAIIVFSEKYVKLKRDNKDIHELIDGLNIAVFNKMSFKEGIDITLDGLREGDEDVIKAPVDEEVLDDEGAEQEQVEQALVEEIPEDVASEVVEDVQASETQEVAEELIEEGDEIEAKTVQATDEVIASNGLDIKFMYKRSFLSRLIQSGETPQGLYTEIKNYILKYKNVRDKISWGYETFSYKRVPQVKLCMRGKSLYAYFALTDEEIESLRIDEKVEAGKYLAVPAKIKITGVIKLHRAMKAVDVLFARLGIVAGEVPTEQYSYTYQTDAQLLEQGLIKLEKGFSAPIQDPVQEEIMDEQETPVVENIEPIVAEQEAVATEEIEESEQAKGLNIKSKYNRSFFARLIQGGDKLQELYTKLKNHILKYKGVNDRGCWGHETFSYKRAPIVELCIRGKSLYAYLSLNDSEIDKLLIDEKVETHKYQAVPAKIKISGPIKLNRALKAIDVICTRMDIALKTEEPAEIYSYSYQTDEELVEQGLVKENF